jgi:hypothetical protein
VGLRARTLVNHWLPAGHHTVTWSPASDGDERLGPGVYFYRITAGAFRDRRRLVLTAR